ncbi:MAG: surface carbohydrate biosynthesis protein [Thiogranum sp.]
MSSANSLLLIPVENQVRELDPKLLLACVAAQRGFSSIVGSRREMEFNIDSFPSAIYLSKSMTIRSLMFFRVARRFGHRIVAWDEEALVHLPPKTYFSRRLDASAIKYVLNLFAWGQDNVELWRQYPHTPEQTPIHAVGNPRGDMLRSEIRAFYDKDAEALRRKYGDFILVNTNFNHVNAFGPDINLFMPSKKPGGKARFGRAARGMSREYARGLWEHKHAVFAHFRELIPALEQAFPRHNIIVRPHPTENQQVYKDIAAGCRRVQVTNEGNVVPWLMAAQALVHNGCTTAVEAFVMNVPAVSYRASINEDYDNGFYRLPNGLSHECFDFDELKQTLEKIFSGEMGVPEGADRRALIDRYLEAQDGPLACERMVSVLETMSDMQAGRGGQPVSVRLQRWLLAKGLNMARHVKSRLPGSHNKPEYQLHRYPVLPLDDVRKRIARFQELLGYKKDFRIEPVSDVLFRIEA